MTLSHASIISAKAEGIPMTRLVNTLLEWGMTKLEQRADQTGNPRATPYRRKKHILGGALCDSP